MLILRELSLQRGTQPLFDQVDLTVYPGQRVGLTGANGTGKSSLFALIRGELHPDRGELEMPPRWVVAHVAQETPGSDISALDHVLEGDGELMDIQRRLVQAQSRGDGAEIAQLHARLDAVDGYSARARAAQLLAGLGFAQERLEDPVTSFSGGWRVRLNLARALMARSDLLLLDEPTNHLDLDAVIWLEQWLKAYPGTLLLVSHDRDFLDSVVEQVAYIENRDIHLYSGGYTAFEQQRAAQLTLQQAAFVKQQRQIEHLESFINRFKAKATKARQAQSRVKALEKLERIAPAHMDSPFSFQFPEPKKLPNPLLRLDKAVVGYGQTPILAGLGLVIQPGTRLGLLGPNGAGKSTLIKLLAGELQLLEGKREEGQGLTVGYFAQHQLEQLRPEWSPVEHLQKKIDPQAGEQELRDFLGGFDFRGDKALEPVAPFSGGEKARLALAMLVRAAPNLLLLDEPTNHLDLEMRHALTLALQEYQGAMVLVSHDRHLLRTTTDEFLLVEGARARPFAGDLEDYRQWLAERNRALQAPRDRGEAGQAAARKDRKRQEAEKRNQLAQRRRPLERRLKELERALEKLEGEARELQAALAQPDIYDESAKGRLKELLLRQSRVAGDLEYTEEQWLKLQEQLEALAAQPGQQ